MFCNSIQNQHNTCPVDFPIKNVFVKHQDSTAPCTKYVSFGISDDRKSIWVDNGCRATFTVTFIEYQGKDIFRGCVDNSWTKFEHLLYSFLGELLVFLGEPPINIEPF